MKKQTTIPLTFHLYRVIFTLLALLPITFFALAFVGAGPFADFLAPFTGALKDWFSNSTWIPLP
jgi:hypothetical protein